ncbi:MAG: MBG-2 domain-containing protein, partial [Atopobium sp.]|nr:MBG-2 domain-containing protein [Atopobium sp.]
AQKNHVVRATIKNGASYDFTIPMMMDVEKGTVAVPTATNYDYDGQEHNGYDISAHLNVAINGTIAATHAGTYDVVMDLIDPVNYTWEDGTTSTKTGSWTIRKAHLTATYEGEAVEEGKTPELKLNVTGFVNGETADTAYQYTAPTLTAPDVSVGDHELTPTGGTAGDYDFTYVAGMLKVTKTAVQPGGQSNNQGGSQNGSQSGSQGNNQQQNETGKTGKTGKKVKSGKKSVIPDMSDPTVISTVAGFTIASVGSIAAGIALRKRA